MSPREFSSLRAALVGPALLLAVGCAAGCSKVSIDYGGRPCGDDGSCGDDPAYTCDIQSNLCVTLGDPCTAEGQATPCAPGAFDCSGQCRVCSQGAWSECRNIAGDECIPGTLASCVEDGLQICNAQGFVETMPCPFGCAGGDGALGRCNECAPGTTTCVGNRFVTCGDDGRVAGDELCAVGNDCADVVCNPDVGCTSVGVAPDGAPCPGTDGSRCTSSCIDGVCTDAAPPVCDDDVECTDDACDDEAGCLFVDSPAGAACAGADPDRCNSSCDGQGTCRDDTPVDCERGPCSADTCDPTTGACLQQPEPEGTVCRPPSDGPDGCDAEERCDGVSLECPPDDLEPVGTPCGDPGQRPCDDPDTCDAMGVCQPNYLPSGASCGDGTDTECDHADTCDGLGSCDPNLEPAGARCGDQGAPCLHDDACDGDGACVDAGAKEDGTPCGDSSSTECDLPDTCRSGVCDPNWLADDEPCGPAGPCRIQGACTDGLCEGARVEEAGTLCGDTEDHACSLADTCDATGTCLPNHLPDGEPGGRPCTDCSFRAFDYDPWNLQNRFPDGLCAGACADGTCPACDGGPTAPTCTTDQDCGSCETGQPCQGARCVFREHFACADRLSGSHEPANWPCLRSTCVLDDNDSYDVRVGGDCGHNGVNGTTRRVFMTYVFETSAANHEAPFHVWLRLIADANHDIAEQSYYCSLTGTTAGTYRFRILRPNDTDRWGPDCQGVGNTPEYCWAAIDGDQDGNNGYQPVYLQAGTHTLHCAIVLDRGDESAGFDGILVTNDLYFVPDSTRGVTLAPTCNDDAMTAGTCTRDDGTPFNWGGPVAPGNVGACTWADAPGGGACAPCAGQKCVCGSRGACIATCGDGDLDVGEECDGAALEGRTCTFFGYTEGTLACTNDCTLDVSGCTDSCGNGVSEDGEECDGNSLRGYDCEDLGFSGGTLACDGDCVFDTSGCF